MTDFACLARVPRYDDAMRASLGNLGIRETFSTTNPEPDSDVPTDVRLIVPTMNTAQAGANLVRAVGIAVEVRSPWAIMEPGWDG